MNLTKEDKEFIKTLSKKLKYDNEYSNNNDYSMYLVTNKSVYEKECLINEDHDLIESGVFLTRKEAQDFINCENKSGFLLEPIIIKISSTDAIDELLQIVHKLAKGLEDE